MKATAIMGQSWRLIWQRKQLLRLGLVSTAAALLAWAALNQADTLAWVESPALMERLTGTPRAAYSDIWGVNNSIVIGPLTFGVLVICLVLWLAGLAARGGLITAVNDLDTGQKSSFGQSFRQGWRKVLPLAGMTILLFIVPVILGIILAISVAVVFAGTITGIVAGTSGEANSVLAGLGLIGLLVVCCLGLAIALLTIVLYLIYSLAYRGMMLRNLGVMDSIRHGWRVLRDNLGEILLLGLVFFVINLPFYWLAIRRMGWAFTLRTFVAVGLISLFSRLTPGWIGFEHLHPLYAAVAGGGLMGMGLLILFRHRTGLGGFNILALYLQGRGLVRAGYFQLAVDLVILAAALFVLDWHQVLLSVLGAAVLNVIIGINHRPGRYMAVS